MSELANFISVCGSSLEYCRELANATPIIFENILVKLDSIVLAAACLIDAENELVSRVIQKIEDAIMTTEQMMQAKDNKPWRPKIDIDMDQIERLLSLNFTAVRIADMLGISRRTLYRRFQEMDISISSLYTNISRNELCQAVQELIMSYPNCGYKQMKGFLFTRGIKVPELNVREVMREVDPNGVFQRMRGNRAIVRRQYFVTYSNEIWHIDTHHKLKRWKVVVRGGIDGKSRTCIYLDAGGDNRAASNLFSFMKGVGRYGVPIRCRSDKGTENLGVARFMLTARGTGRNSHICGRSVHNQRIERFWRDVHYQCISVYSRLFRMLEENGVLNVEEDLHLALLHHIFLPRICNHLNCFMIGWNHHSIRTENNHSPIQLMYLHLPPESFDMNMSQIDDPAYVGINSEQDLQNFEENPEQDTLTNPHPVLPIQNLLNSNQIRHLNDINPLKESSCYGMDIYIEALEIIMSM